MKLLNLSAQQLLKKLKNKQLTSVELCKAYINQKKKYDKNIQAWEYFNEKKGVVPSTKWKKENLDESEKTNTFLAYSSSKVENENQIIKSGKIMEIAKSIAPIALAIIMFGLGLGLTVEDFKRVLKYPRDFFVGFLCQVILLPIIAFILIHIITLPPEIALGVMIIASAPGGVTSNVLTKFADGDVALSVSLTAIVSLLCIFTVPLIVFNSAELIGIATVSYTHLTLPTNREV